MEVSRASRQRRATFNDRHTFGVTDVGVRDGGTVHCPAVHALACMRGVSLFGPFAVQVVGQDRFDRGISAGVDDQRAFTGSVERRRAMTFDETEDAEAGAQAQNRVFALPHDHLNQRHSIRPDFLRHAVQAFGRSASVELMIGGHMLHYGAVAAIA